MLGSIQLRPYFPPLLFWVYFCLTCDVVLRCRRSHPQLLDEQQDPALPSFITLSSPKSWFPWSHVTLNQQEIDLIPAPIRSSGLPRNWNPIILCQVDLHMRNTCGESLKAVQTTCFTCSVLILCRVRLSSSPWIKSAFVQRVGLFPKECHKT